jgi:hypothetical protein
MIDLSPSALTEAEMTELTAGLFAPRRPTLFSVQPDDRRDDHTAADFGQARARR